ncbi:hypothetical protein BCT92_08065 [Vibrio sp. 10N.261.52.E5]|nr:MULTISPECIES: GGDEF domain-containing protein [unclassified Vibrio]PMK72742.1 hypothetical protein BCT92_08065 [Vibrio sp. 10N.261.52.E5]TKF84770.1 PAS domain-containing protein [Vibrio sp. F13]
MNKLSYDRKMPLYVVSALVLNMAFSLWLLSIASTPAMFFSVCALFLLSTLITARLYRHEMAQSKNNLSEAIIDGVAGFIVLDSQLRVIQVNQQFSRVSGYAFDQVESRPISDLCFMNNSSLITTITRSLKENQRWKGELSGVSRLGEQFTVNVVVEKLTEILPHNNKYVVTFTDISRRKILERRLRMLVETDSLTGCWNRRRFDNDLKHYSNLAERYGYTHSCFALVHVFFPEPKSAFSGFAAAPLEKKQRWYAAFRAMIISYPVVCFFFIFRIFEALLTMMFIALLSLMITSEKSIKLSAFLVISNGIGGLLAIAAFSILSIVPNIVFYSLFIGLIAILMATKIYTVPEKAPIFATAFSTLLVLVGSTLMSSGDIDSNTLIRIFQLVLIGIYMILASLFLETRNWKFLQNQP